MAPDGDGSDLLLDWIVVEPEPMVAEIPSQSRPLFERILCGIVNRTLWNSFLFCFAQQLCQENKYWSCLFTAQHQVQLRGELVFSGMPLNSTKFSDSSENFFAARRVGRFSIKELPPDVGSAAEPHGGGNIEKVIVSRISISLKVSAERA